MKLINYHLLPIALVLSLAFSACSTEKSLSQKEQAQFTIKGNTLVKQTFDRLSHSLKTAISARGIENAVSYCQINTYALIHTYATDAVTIGRTALKYRNPANKPDTAELRILKLFAAQIEKGLTSDSLKPLIEKGSNSIVHFYKPIILQQLCASCHGEKANITQSTLWKTIDSLYPSDLAYGFKLGDFRGMWHVSFAGN